MVENDENYASFLRTSLEDFGSELTQRLFELNSECNISETLYEQNAFLNYIQEEAFSFDGSDFDINNHKKRALSQSSEALNNINLQKKLNQQVFSDLPSENFCSISRKERARIEDLLDENDKILKILEENLRCNNSLEPNIVLMQAFRGNTETVLQIFSTKQGSIGQMPPLPVKLNTLFLSCNNTISTSNNPVQLSSTDSVSKAFEASALNIDNARKTTDGTSSNVNEIKSANVGEEAERNDDLFYFEEQSDFLVRNQQ